MVKRWIPWGRACLVGLVLFGAVIDAQAARKTYPIGKFSDDYHASVTVEDSNEVFRPGAVSIFNSKTGKRIIHVTADELTVDIAEGKAVPNIKQLPYGEQSVLIYEDFNFDGRKDLAIMDGQNSCYHGPSFQIYLATGSGFRPSPDFTELAQNFCGMFQVDVASKTLSTMTKSGCCWHQFNEYRVAGDRPVLVRSVEDEVAGGAPLAYRKMSVWEKGHKRRTSYQLEEDVGHLQTFLSFPLKESNKSVVVFRAEGDMLDYALLKADGDVEFSYALDVLGYRRGAVSDEPLPEMRLAREGHALSFRNGKYTYTIHDSAERLGVSVDFNKRSVFLAGDPAGKKGGLAQLRQLKDVPANLAVASTAQKPTMEKKP
jgi:hypothetical protein